MYLIIELLGKQYKVHHNLKIKIEKLNLNVNTILFVNKIFLLNSKKFFIVNNYFLNKIIVIARIIKHGKNKCLNILKFKRRKGYKKKIKFIKRYTVINIEFIIKDLFIFFKNGSKKIGRVF